MTRIGMRTRPWERTQVNSSINTQATEYRPAHVRELRSHAGLPVEGTLGLRCRRGPDQHAARAGSRAAESECAARLGFDDRRFLRGIRRRVSTARNCGSSPAASNIAIPTAKSAGARPRAGIASRSKAMRCRCRCRLSTRARCWVAATLKRSAASPGRSAPIRADWIVFDRFEMKYDEHTDCVEFVRVRRASSTTCTPTGS